MPLNKNENWIACFFKEKITLKQWKIITSFDPRVRTIDQGPDIRPLRKHKVQKLTDSNSEKRMIHLRKLLENKNGKFHDGETTLQLT